MNRVTPNESGLSPTRYVVRPEGERVAYRLLEGRTPTVVFLSGYASDMGGTKACYLEACCARWGQAYLCLDYRGHGLSDGRFEDGTISAWCDDARLVIEAATGDSSPLVLVGSSMGGWMMLLLARHFAPRISGLVGIASAPDFTRDTMPARLTEANRKELAATGIAHLPNRYGPEPGIVTAKLLEDGNANLVLEDGLELDCPVRLIHGLADPDVPWQRSLAISEAISGADVRITLLKAGEHRLSSPGELALIADEIGALLGIDSPAGQAT